MAVAAAEPATKDRILQVAAGLFQEHGYAGVSLKQIAAQVGISAAALYWYFPNKQAILRESLLGALTGFVAEVEAGCRDGSPPERLAGFVRGHVTQSLKHRELGPFGALYGLQQLSRHLDADDKQKLRRLQRSHLACLTEILEDGAAKGFFSVREPTVMAFGVMTMCDYVTSWYRPDGRLTLEEVADLYATMGLRIAGYAPALEAR